MQWVFACTTRTYDAVPYRSATCRGGNAPADSLLKSSTSTPRAPAARRLVSSAVQTERSVAGSASRRRLACSNASHRR
eukprot:scaffold98044_cov72-Phaeocystis_antarctica.AAC.2